MAEQKRALRLDAGQFTRLIKITRATSRYSERDVLVLMLASTGDMETVRVLLGHSSMNCSQRYVDVDPTILCAMFKDAV